MATFSSNDFVARIDHDRAVKARIDAIVTGLFVAVIEVHGENCFGKNLLRRANHRFEHPLVGVLAGAFGELDDKGRLALDVAAEQAQVCSMLLML